MTKQTVTKASIIRQVLAEIPDPESAPEVRVLAIARSKQPTLKFTRADVSCIRTDIRRRAGVKTLTHDVCARFASNGHGNPLNALVEMAASIPAPKPPQAVTVPALLAAAELLKAAGSKAAAVDALEAVALIREVR